MKEIFDVEKAIRRAWIWLLLIPVGGILGQLVGHLVAWLVGQKEEGPLTVSWWKVLLIVTPATILTVAPAYVSARMGFQIKKEEKKIGWLFILVGGLICVTFLAITILTSAGVGQ